MVTKVGKAVEKLDPSDTCQQERKTGPPLWEKIRKCLRKLNRVTTWQLHAEVYTKGNENVGPHENFNVDVQSSLNRNRQKVQTT